MAEEKTKPNTDATEPEKEWEVTTERFVAFFDIMGFKDRVDKNSHEKVFNDLNQIKIILTAIERGKYGLGQEKKTIKTAIFSDSIILFSEDDSKSSLYAMALSCVGLISHAFNNDIPIKGALSSGKISADLKRSIFFGKPIINAHLLHEELYFYGIVLDENAEKKVKDFEIEKMQTNFSKMFVRYSVPFKFGKTNHYTINWPSFIEGYLRKEKDRSPADILIDLSLTMSGKPRIYLDNTIEFYEKTYEPIYEQ